MDYASSIVFQYSSNIHESREIHRDTRRSTDTLKLIIEGGQALLRDLGLGKTIWNFFVKVASDFGNFISMGSVISKNGLLSIMSL